MRGEKEETTNFHGDKIERGCSLAKANYEGRWKVSWSAA
jgi:hypothetical protein